MIYTEYSRIHALMPESGIKSVEDNKLCSVFTLNICDIKEHISSLLCLSINDEMTVPRTSKLINLKSEIMLIENNIFYSVTLPCWGDPQYGGMPE